MRILVRLDSNGPDGTEEALTVMESHWFEGGLSFKADAGLSIAAKEITREEVMKLRDALTTWLAEK